MQTIYTHGTALQAENPEQLVQFRKFGWGAEIVFILPREGPPTFFEIEGPSSWFHLPLTGIPDAHGTGHTLLTGVRLLFETSNCRITDLHIYDGPTLLAKHNYPENATNFPGGLKSNLSEPVAIDLAEHRKLRYAPGISFRASCHSADLPRDVREREVLPILTVAAGGAAYRAESIFSELADEITEVGRFVGLKP